MLELQQRKLQREEAILSSLNKLDYLSRSQIQRLHGLAGDRNARRILANMKPYLASFRGDTGESVYYLNKAGRERVNAVNVRQKSAQVGHYIMRNDAYIHFGAPAEWKNEAKITVEGVVTVIADAYFRHNQRRCFLEVDHTQHMSKNREKVDRYRKMKDAGVFQEKYGYYPKLIWITLTEARRAQISELCEGLDSAVYVWSDIK